MTYEPKVNDYVVWTTELGMVHKRMGLLLRVRQNQREVGTTPQRYCSIEIATKPRPNCDLIRFYIRESHVCICCYESNWSELELHSEEDLKQDDTDPDELSYGAYKSQKHRYSDPQ